MTLASGFPPEFLHEQLRRRLRPGVVIKLMTAMDDGEVHEKRFVVVHVDDATIACVINTKVSKFIAKNPELLQCQVLMKQQDHDFMSHDSQVDCSKTWRFRTDDVVRDLMKRPEWLLGDAVGALRQQMVAAIKFAPTLAPREAALLCQALENVD